MKNLEEIIEILTQEVYRIQIQGRALSATEIARVEAIYQALPKLREALAILKEDSHQSTLITYKIAQDSDGKLKQAARVACNFWNRFIVPKNSIVVRLSLFLSERDVIARAYQPYERDGVSYGVVEFNTRFLQNFSRNEIAGTIIHEIGHTLGMGWKEWEKLFEKRNGKFKTDAIASLDELKDMRVETDYEQGTVYSHWDEERHDRELMTGFKDLNEHVLPVTIDVMSLLGHQVAEKLPEKTNLNLLLDTLSHVIFTRKAEAKALNLDHFEETEVWENVPHDAPLEERQ